MAIRGGFSASDKLKELEREVSMRDRVYPKLVARGAMKQADADRQLAIMREIADDYRSEAAISDSYSRMWQLPFDFSQLR